MQSGKHWSPCHPVVWADARGPSTRKTNPSQWTRWTTRLRWSGIDLYRLVQDGGKSFPPARASQRSSFSARYGLTKNEKGLRSQGTWQGRIKAVLEKSYYKEATGSLRWMNRFVLSLVLRSRRLRLSVFGEVMRSAPFVLIQGSRSTVTQAIMRAGCGAFRPRYCSCTRAHEQGACVQGDLNRLMKRGACRKIVSSSWT